MWRDDYLLLVSNRLLYAENGIEADLAAAIILNLEKYSIRTTFVTLMAIAAGIAVNGASFAQQGPQEYLRNASARFRTTASWRRLR